MKYVCSICGYVYDEDVEGTLFSELPDSWTCPWCGAPKSLFKAQEIEKAPKKEEPKKDKEIKVVKDNDIKLSNGQLSVLFSNLKRGCEKQYQYEAMECFDQIAKYFANLEDDEKDANIDALLTLFSDDMNDKYKQFDSIATEKADRGALRVKVWGEKVTNMAKTILERYKNEGEDFLKNNNVYVCTVCGFIFVGKEPPKLCPVCKVPDWKFEKITGRETL